MLKFDLIMNQLIKVKKENPDYKVYVTGHRYVVFYPEEIIGRIYLFYCEAFKSIDFPSVKLYYPYCC
jgi:hypothetical protein